MKVDGGIYYSFYCATNTKGEIYLPKSPAYFCQISLEDENKRPVKRTRAGADYGSRFEELKPSYPSTHSGLPSKMMGLQTVRVYRTNDSGTAFPLPAPDQLFTVPPGAAKYKLKMQFQVFERITNNSINTLRLVHFPAVEYEITNDARTPSQK
jgi:hypothetical protein